MSKLNKKAQVTLFIIIGVVLLLSLFAVIYFTLIYEGPEPDTITTTELPFWADPVNEYVSSCIKQFAIRGFKEIGYHGGYINVSDQELSLDRSFNINQFQPTESDFLVISNTGFLPVAYWWYLESENDCSLCELHTQMVTLSEVEEQMNIYIERNLIGCLDDFESFKQQGFEIETGDLSVETSINLHDVSIVVDYPTTLKKDTASIKIPQFSIDLDLHFREIYELALLMSLYEIDFQRLEDVLINIIGAYSGTPDPNSIPPIYWREESYNTVSWQMSDVETKLREAVLAPNIAQMQVGKTRGAVHIQADPSAPDYVQGIYDNLFWDFLVNFSYPHLDIDFMYNPSWPIYFDISPRRGNTLEPSVIRQSFPLNVLPPDQNNEYAFFYDISFPVLITIRDDRSLKKEGELGYTFMFALETNIRDNKNLLDWNQGEGTVGTWDTSNVAMSMAVDDTVIGNCTSSSGGSVWYCQVTGNSYNDQNLCNTNCYETTTSNINIEAVETLICDSSQRFAGPLTVNVLDSTTLEPVPDAAVTFTCGTYRSCPMESTNNNGTLTLGFPVCIGSGFLSIDKDGFLTHIEPDVSTEINNSATYTIYLDRLRDVNYTARYINASNLYQTQKYLTSVAFHSYRRLYGPATTTGSLPYSEYGIVQEVYDDVSRNTVFCEAQNPCMSNCGLQFGCDETPIILAYINTFAKIPIYTATPMVPEIEYWHQTNFSMVPTALRDYILPAVSNINGIIDGTTIASLIGRNDFDHDFFNDTDAIARSAEYEETLSEMVKNIVFLSDPQITSSSTIDAYRNSSSPLRENDTLFIILEKVKESPYEQNMPVPAAALEFDRPSSMRILPGTYNVLMTFQDANGVYIESSGGISDIDFSPALLGGAELTEYSGQWVVEEEDLDENKYIMFYFFKFDEPIEVDDLNEIEFTTNHSKRFRSFIEPEFIR